MARRTVDRLRTNEFMICKVKGCKFKGRYKGYCYNHYQQQYRKKINYVLFLKANGVINPQGNKRRRYCDVDAVLLHKMEDKKIGGEK